MAPTHCEYPGCRDTTSRKFPELVERGRRRCCVFRLFCAAHVPSDVMHMTAAVVADVLPTHARPTGQIHVPRVWEITGRAPASWRRAVRTH